MCIRSQYTLYWRQYQRERERQRQRDRDRAQHTIALSIPCTSPSTFCVYTHGGRNRQCTNLFSEDQTNPSLFASVVCLGWLAGEIRPAEVCEGMNRSSDVHLRLEDTVGLSNAKSLLRVVSKLSCAGGKIRLCWMSLPPPTPTSLAPLPPFPLSPGSPTQSVLVLFHQKRHD